MRVLWALLLSGLLTATVVLAIDHDRDLQTLNKDPDIRQEQALAYLYTLKKEYKVLHQQHIKLSNLYIKDNDDQKAKNDLVVVLQIKTQMLHTVMEVVEFIEVAEKENADDGL